MADDELTQARRWLATDKPQREAAVKQDGAATAADVAATLAARDQAARDAVCAAWERLNVERKA